MSYSIGFASGYFGSNKKAMSLKIDSSLPLNTFIDLLELPEIVKKIKKYQNRYKGLVLCQEHEGHLFILDPKEQSQVVKERLEEVNEALVAKDLMKEF